VLRLRPRKSTVDADHAFPLAQGHAQTSRAIRVGHIALSFHDAAAEQVELLLRSYGHEIERHSALHEDMFASLASDSFDGTLALGSWPVRCRRT
jgi:hypothetical protein